jgi:UDP-N-acetylglucosamine 2-epimerase (non-hydrolysing)
MKLNKKKLKIITVVGTRPEIIRLSRIFSVLDKYCEHILIHTGQNFDKNLKDLFFQSMNIRKPDLALSMNSLSLASQLAKIFEAVEEDVIRNRPDAVVILGDTNSGLSAIIVKRMGIPVYHLEAGNRSFDINVPEETNRKIIDHTSDFNLVYSESSRRNLLNEGLHPRNIALIGSPMKEVIEANRMEINASDILNDLQITDGEFILVSVHRQENTNKDARTIEFFDSLDQIATTFEIPVIVTTHPRTRQVIEKSQKTFDNRVKFLDPFDFYGYCKLQQKARVVLSDSGSLSEEAAILGFKAITLRDSMERPEAMETGTVIMSGLNFQAIKEAIFVAETSKFKPVSPPEYEIQDSSERTVRFIVSTLGRHNFWTGKR